MTATWSTKTAHRRVALVGAGFIADYHLPARRGMSDVELVGLFDRDPNRTSKVCAQWGIAPASSLDELLQRRPDVVHVLTPPPLHASVARACLKSGAHILLEKPAAVSSEECDDLPRLASAVGRVVGVNHNALYLPAFTKVTKWVHGWSLGRPEHVTVWWNGSSKYPRASPRTSFQVSGTFGAMVCGHISITHAPRSVWGGNPTAIAICFCAKHCCRTCSGSSPVIRASLDPVS